MVRIELNHDWCKTCYICIDLCPVNVFSKTDQISKKGAALVEIRNLEACTGCLQCELLCPDQAISVTKE
ncbi:MAG: 4Fe-4S binding protein [Candidatus Hodarchaeota archaeon]